MTYLEWLKKNPTILKEKTELDDATIQLLADWFGFRTIVDDDKFTTFFLREINIDAWQYKELLRLESIEIDPMVSNYIERWVRRKGTNTSNITRSESSNGTTTGRTTSNGSSTSSPGVTEETETITTPNTTVTTHGDASGTSSGESESTRSGESTSKGTNKSKTTNEGEGSRKALSGVLPDSSTYATGGSAGIDINGFPNALNWGYTNTQNGERTNSKDSSSNEGETNQEDTDSSTESGTQSATTSSESSSTTTTSGTDTSTTTTTRRGSDETTTTDTRTDEGTSESSSNGTEKGDNTFNNEDREISTGRGEAPQDMLKRAKEWFSTMNAFKWLTGKLDNCFLGVYDI